MLKILSIFSFFIFLTSSVLAKSFNILDYGAIAGGKIINTSAIQKTIDVCNNNGGGTVLIPAGTYLTGTIHLKSNIDLFLEAGAVLLGSPNLTDYEKYTTQEYGLNYYGILYTLNAENVSITGQGTIDGHNSAYFDYSRAKKIDTVSSKYTRQKNNYRHVSSGIGDGPAEPLERPRQMVVFSGCKNIHVQTISLLNSPFWTLHFADCDGVQVTGIRLWSGLLTPNGDGIDITSSNNVIITDCDIRTGDDAIVIGGYNHHFEIPGFNRSYHSAENVVVSNCNLQSASSAIRIGYLDQNTVKNIHFSHINITNSTRGIGLFLRDEGSLENITFSDIFIETKLRTGDWWGNGEPIHISAIRGKENVKLGVIKNVVFNNITCVGENHILIYGSAESIIQDIRFDNISFKIENSRLNDVAGGNIDLRSTSNPAEALFCSNIPGVMACYVNGLTMTDFRLTWSPQIVQPYFSDGVSVSHFKNFRLTRFHGGPSPSGTNAHAVSLNDGDNAAVEADDVQRTKVLHYLSLK